MHSDRADDAVALLGEEKGIAMTSNGGDRPAREDVERVLERATNDAEFKSRLLDDPEQALKDLGVLGVGDASGGERARYGLFSGVGGGGSYDEGGAESQMRCSYTCMVAATCSVTCRTVTCKCTDC